MSMYTPINFACPNCGELNEFDLFASVNADRRPDLRDDIISGAFMRITCHACSTDFRPEPDLNYLDFGNGLWLMAKPAGWVQHWETEEAQAQEVFDAAYGSAAPATARDIGSTLRARVTFGWPGFREKLIIAQEGLDDLALEKTKMSILRNKPDNPVQAGIELRLLSVDGPLFYMGWVTATTNEALQVFTTQRALYDDVRADTEWASIDAVFAGKMFVDMQRMFITATAKLAEPA